jgi:hypothetical protein
MTGCLHHRQVKGEDDDGDKKPKELLQTRAGILEGVPVKRNG